jgi:hypothetical protein
MFTECLLIVHRHGLTQRNGAELTPGSLDTQEIFRAFNKKRDLGAGGHASYYSAVCATKCKLLSVAKDVLCATMSAVALRELMEAAGSQEEFLQERFEFLRTSRVSFEQVSFRFALGLLSFCTGFAFVSHWVCFRFALASLSFRTCFAFVSHLLCFRFALDLLSFRTCFAFVSHLLCFDFALALL